jgi:hypothetical protein
MTAGRAGLFPAQQYLHEVGVRIGFKSDVRKGVAASFADDSNWIGHKDAASQSGTMDLWPFGKTLDLRVYFGRSELQVHVMNAIMAVATTARLLGQQAKPKPKPKPKPQSAITSPRR